MDSRIRDALELARKVYDNYGHNDNNAVELIEVFASERERKAREETARKCVEAAWDWFCGKSKQDNYPAAKESLEAAIMEAAHE